MLLKTDTQGWDLEVIEGAAGCLERVVALQVELSVRPIYEGSPGWLEVLARLRASDLCQLVGRVSARTLRRSMQPSRPQARR